MNLAAGANTATWYFSSELLQFSLSLSSCINRADYIKVHDGRTASYPAIGLFCNQGSHYEILSTGPELYIEFVSHSVDPGQGFKAKFQFQSGKLNYIMYYLPTNLTNWPKSRRGESAFVLRYWTMWLWYECLLNGNSRNLLLNLWNFQSWFILWISFRSHEPIRPYYLVALGTHPQKAEWES